MDLPISIAIAVLFVVAALLLPIVVNRVPLVSPPGPLRRLQTYLSTNVVETENGSAFPERELHRFRADADRAYAAAREAIAELGWHLDYDNPAQLELAAVVTTPLLRFRDDVKVKILPTDDAGVVQLLVRSQSRVGRGDLGANTRHLLDLYDALARRSVAMQA